MPAVWQERAIDVSLVPLLPAEAEQLLTDRRAEPTLVGEGDLSLARLAARGLSGTQIARDLDIAPRTVYRRLARLRNVFGVESTAELAAELARRGL